VGLAPSQGSAGSVKLSCNSTIEDRRRLRDNRARVSPGSQPDVAIAVLIMPAKFCALPVPIRNRRVWQKHIAIKLRIVWYVPHDARHLQRDRSAQTRRIGDLAIGRGCDDLSNDIGGAEIFSRRAL